VHWQQADAMQLPFDDASFDVVACQFARCSSPTGPRVRRGAAGLRRGGVFIFNVWDRIEETSLPTP